MSKKRNIYILFPIVLIVWGIIGFKIYQQLKPNKQANNQLKEHYSFKPVTEVDDFTYTLHTDYRDPFLGTINKKRRKVPLITKPKTIMKTKKVTTFPRCIYRGLVNPKAHPSEAVFMIEVNGKSELFKLGKSYADIKLLGGDAKMVQIQHQDSIQKLLLKP